MKTPEQKQKHATYMRQWFKDNPEKRREIRQRYIENNRDMHHKHSRLYNERHPEKRKAQRAVNHALRDGKLIRPNCCEECGKVCIPQGHHKDYNKLLEVVWLCLVCHRKVVT